MDEVKRWPVSTMEAEEAHALIRQIVPHDSPLSAQVQRVIFGLIILSPNYLMTISDQSTGLSLTELTYDECNTIIEAVNSHKNTDVWSVSYMLATFTAYYRQKPFTDKYWLFMSKYLQLILLIVKRQDKHFNKVNKLGVRIRMSLKKNSSQTAIIDELIDIHDSSANVFQNFADIELYEQDMRHREETGLVKTHNLAKKIGEIRLAYEVIIKDKSYIERQRRGNGQSVIIKKVREDQDVLLTDEETRRMRFPEEYSGNNVVRSENLADDDPPTLLDNKYNPTRKTAKSSQLQQYQVKTSYLHSKRNRFMFPSSTRLLTLSDYQSVFVKLWDMVSNEEQHNRRTASILLLSMITGSSIKNVISEVSSNKSQRQFLVEEESDATVIQNSINVTVNRRDVIKSVVKSHSNHFSLPLPVTLQALLQYKFEVEPTDVNQFLKVLKESFSLPLFTAPDMSAQLIQKSTDTEEKEVACSIFIDVRYDVVISFIREVDNLKPELREKELENTAIKYGIHLLNAKKFYRNASSLNNNDKLITQVKGQGAQAIITTALDKAYQMSVHNPDKLRPFVRTYQKKHITSRSYLKFGIKQSQHELLAEFLKIGCKIIASQHWQLTSKSVKEVRDFKAKYKLDSAIRVGTKLSCVGFEVRIIRKIKSSSADATVYESSGVLKFLGEILVILLDWNQDGEE